MENLKLVDAIYYLQKIAGKGGWTYVALPEIAPNKKAPFGWVSVRGSIDEFEIRKYKLLPMGNGQLFLPVKAQIRKKIGKQHGDTVHIILYHDNEPLEVPEELLLCLQDEPAAWHFFETLKESQQQQYVKWIYSAKTDLLQVERIAASLDQLSRQLKFNDERH
jgi:hypothetical protein